MAKGPGWRLTIIIIIIIMYIYIAQDHAMLQTTENYDSDTDLSIAWNRLQHGNGWYWSQEN